MRAAAEVAGAGDPLAAHDERLSRRLGLRAERVELREETAAPGNPDGNLVA